MGLGLDHQRGRFAPLASEIQLKFNVGLEYWKSRFKFPP
jgi:hypothetical protein